jgi:hypothetical protein
MFFRVYRPAVATQGNTQVAVPSADGVWGFWSVGPVPPSGRRWTGE